MHRRTGKKSTKPKIKILSVGIKIVSLYCHREQGHWIVRDIYLHKAVSGSVCHAFLKTGNILINQRIKRIKVIDYFDCFD